VADDIEDNRRLFYVALTRARKGVFISSPFLTADGREQVKSRFIREINPELVAEGDMSGYEKLIEDTPHFFISEAKPSEPNVHDKKFLQELFLKRGLSATALNNYIACPWRYFYRNLVRMPEAQQPYLMYGNAVHAALRSFFDAKSGDKDFLLAEFARNLSSQPFLEHEVQRYKIRGEKALSAYFDNYELSSGSSNTINEFNVGSIMLDDKIRLTGKIDKIEPSLGGEVNVVDYKTGRRKTRGELEGQTKNATGNERRQLIFYKLLLDKLPTFAKATAGKPKFSYIMTSGEIDFVEPEKRTGKFYKERFVITKDNTAQLINQIRQVASEILSLSFWDKRCADRRCEYCKLQDVVKN